MRVKILRKSFSKKMNVRGQMWETLIPWLIAILVILLMLALYYFSSKYGFSLISYIKNLFRFGK